MILCVSDMISGRRYLSKDLSELNLVEAVHKELKVNFRFFVYLEISCKSWSMNVVCKTDKLKGEKYVKLF